MVSSTGRLIKLAMIPTAGGGHSACQAGGGAGDEPLSAAAGPRHPQDPRCVHIVVNARRCRIVYLLIMLAPILSTIRDMGSPDFAASHGTSSPLVHDVKCHSCASLLRGGGILLTPTWALMQGCRMMRPTLRCSQQSASTRTTSEVVERLWRQRPGRHDWWLCAEVEQEVEKTICMRVIPRSCNTQLQLPTCVTPVFLKPLRTLQPAAL